MAKSYTPMKIGILGGGQLAQMLALKAHEIGHIPYILSASKDDPAAKVTQNWFKGDLYSQKDLSQFLNKVDIATFESEFLNSETLSKAEKQAKAKIYPSVKTMGLLQDRFSQKNLLVKNNIPTSPFVKVDNYKQALVAWEKLQGPFVLKQRHHGYDGYGTFIFKKLSEIKKYEQQINQNPHGFIAERFIPFKRELAISIVRNKNCVQFLPLVESYQEDSRCLWVKGPIRHAKINSLKIKLKKFAEEINYTGILAFEIFDYKNTLLINELAPRVHNSAHYSQDALVHDQFHMHLLAITNQSLPKVSLNTKAFAMYNLLGSRNTSKFKFPTDSHCHLHWYNKGASRPGRKMGHLNCLSTTAEKALSTLKNSRKRYYL